MIKIDEDSEKIKGRINNFGVSIKDKKSFYQNENFDDELPFSPQIVAKSKTKNRFIKMKILRMKF